MVELAVKADVAQLRELLTQLHDIPQKERTGVRRQLRGTGATVLAEQRALLSGPLPKGIAKSGSHYELRVNKKTSKVGFRKINDYADAETKNTRSSGLRDKIKSALTMNITATAVSQGITFRTYNKNAPMSIGYNAVRFRHPVFAPKGSPGYENSNRWALQGGIPYFFGPVIEGRDAVIVDMSKILTDALEG